MTPCMMYHLKWNQPCLNRFTFEPNILKPKSFKPWKSHKPRKPNPTLYTLRLSSHSGEPYRARKMATTLLPETAQKVLTQEAIRSAAKQSQRCLTVPVKLRRAIKKYLRGLLLPTQHLVIFLYLNACCLVQLCNWINGFGILEQEEPHMKRKVLRLSESFSQIKDVNSQLIASTSKQLVEDPLQGVDQSQRWKIKSSYGDIGLTYRDDETIAYVASRMPAVFSACHRVLKEVFFFQCSIW